MKCCKCSNLVQAGRTHCADCLYRASLQREQGLRRARLVAEWKEQGLCKGCGGMLSHDWQHAWCPNCFMAKRAGKRSARRFGHVRWRHVLQRMHNNICALQLDPKCRMRCGVVPDGMGSIDHKWPKHLAAEYQGKHINGLLNLQWTCKRCNNIKADRFIGVTHY